MRGLSGPCPWTYSLLCTPSLGGLIQSYRFILMRSSVSFFSFMDHAFGVAPKNSSNNFIVLHFTFQSVIHFELIFVKGVRKSVSKFIFCIWTSSCSSTIC